MNIHITPKSAAVAALITAGATAIALGPLNPPPGPVTETSPSLTTIQADLSDLIISQAGNTETAGPYEIYRSPISGDFFSDANGDLIAEGRVYVHSISVLYCQATVFDGPGELDPVGRVITGDWVCRAQNSFVSSAPGAAQWATTTVPVETIVENGLYAAWRFQAGGELGSIIIRYKRLTEGASE